MIEIDTQTILRIVYIVLVVGALYLLFSGKES